MSTSTAYIEGVGIWSERLPAWNTASRILRGEIAAPEEPAKRPSPDLLPANERRRAPDTVAIALAVGSEACAHAQRNPSTLPSVFASTHGDLAITDYMCDTLASTPGLISPTRFHNSVHNAAAGYWAIATGSTRPYTAISADRYSFGNGLLEALVQAQSDNETVLLVAYDIAAQGPLANVVKSTGRLGCALVLGCQPTSNTKHVMQWQLRESEEQGDSINSAKLARTENASLVAGNAMAPALPMLEAIARAPGNIVCAVGPKMGLELELAPMNEYSFRSVS
ncbi:MAG: beta-ketoacyl synthase chain length factor [Betaproteobacteria bacterium]|nr:MAG: beta-ketoacyl synthase chain length factor [Betaproteobacteria bacterium]